MKRLAPVLWALAVIALALVYVLIFTAGGPL